MNRTDSIETKLKELTGHNRARSGDRWPTHRAKARDARTTKLAPSEKDSE